MEELETSGWMSPMRDERARRPYTNAGRTPEVRAMLAAFGFDLAAGTGGRDAHDLLRALRAQPEGDAGPADERCGARRKDPRFLWLQGLWPQGLRGVQRRRSCATTCCCMGCTSRRVKNGSTRSVARTWSRCPARGTAASAESASTGASGTARGATSANMASRFRARSASRGRTGRGCQWG